MTRKEKLDKQDAKIDEFNEEETRLALERYKALSPEKKQDLMDIIDIVRDRLEAISDFAEGKPVEIEEDEKGNMYFTKYKENDGGKKMKDCFIVGFDGGEISFASLDENTIINLINQRNNTNFTIDDKNVTGGGNGDEIFSFDNIDDVYGSFGIDENAKKGDTIYFDTEMWEVSLDRDQYIKDGATEEYIEETKLI